MSCCLALLAFLLPCLVALPCRLALSPCIVAVPCCLALFACCVARACRLNLFAWLVAFRCCFALSPGRTATLGVRLGNLRCYIWPGSLIFCVCSLGNELFILYSAFGHVAYYYISVLLYLARIANVVLFLWFPRGFIYTSTFCLQRVGKNIRSGVRTSHTTLHLVVPAACLFYFSQRAFVLSLALCLQAPCSVPVQSAQCLCMQSVMCWLQHSCCDPAASLFYLRQCARISLFLQRPCFISRSVPLHYVWHCACDLRAVSLCSLQCACALSNVRAAAFVLRSCSVLVLFSAMCSHLFVPAACVFYFSQRAIVLRLTLCLRAACSVRVQSAGCLCRV